MNSVNGISVVIPTYNRAALIRETLDTVFAQTRPADEIIVVDDGSTDDTASVLSRYGDRIRAITIANSGDLVARNTGLRAARGPLVAFCDSDDLWRPEFLSDIARFWDHVPDLLCAYVDFQEFHDGKWAQESKFMAAPKGFWNDLQIIDGVHCIFGRPIVCDLLAFQPFFPSCMMVHRDRFLTLGGWDEGVSRMVGCDFATSLRVAENPPIGVLRRPLVGIRKHAGNFSGDVQRMNLGDADVLDYVLATRPSLAPYRDAIRRSTEARRLAAFDIAFSRGDFEELDHIVSLLPAMPRGLRHQVKREIMRLPLPARDIVWRISMRMK